MLLRWVRLCGVRVMVSAARSVPSFVRLPSLEIGTRMRLRVVTALLLLRLSLLLSLSLSLLSVRMLSVIRVCVGLCATLLRLQFESLSLWLRLRMMVRLTVLIIPSSSALCMALRVSVPLVLWLLLLLCRAIVTAVGTPLVVLWGVLCAVPRRPRAALFAAGIGCNRRGGVATVALLFGRARVLSTVGVVGIALAVAASASAPAGIVIRPAATALLLLVVFGAVVGTLRVLLSAVIVCGLRLLRLVRGRGVVVAVVVVIAVAVLALIRTHRRQMTLSKTKLLPTMQKNERLRTQRRQRM